MLINYDKGYVMLLSKTVDDEVAVVVTRYFLVLLYCSITIELASGVGMDENVNGLVSGICLFLFAAAAITVLPVFAKRLPSIRYDYDEMSIWCVTGCFFALAFYGVVVFWHMGTVANVFIASLALVATQLPLAYFVNKKKRHETKI